MFASFLLLLLHRFSMKHIYLSLKNIFHTVGLGPLAVVYMSIILSAYCAFATKFN